MNYKQTQITRNFGLIRFVIWAIRSKQVRAGIRVQFESTDGEPQHMMESKERQKWLCWNFSCTIVRVSKFFICLNRYHA